MPARDPLFAPWAGATVGQPLLVHAVDGSPAYWLVPIERAERAIGFVRVSLDGRVETAGVLYRHPEQLDRAPGSVTRIDDEAAVAAAREAVPDGEVIGAATYVNDGPPGREAWMVRLRDPSGAVRTMFVTPGGTYERDPSEVSSPDLE